MPYAFLPPEGSTQTITHTQPKSNKVVAFETAEPDIMPGDWAEPGNPTPYELRVTIHTCKRAWQANQEALSHPDCDREVTLNNIHVLEKLYIHLMDYLVE